MSSALFMPGIKGMDNDGNGMMYTAKIIFIGMLLLCSCSSRQNGADAEAVDSMSASGVAQLRYDSIIKVDCRHSGLLHGVDVEVFFERYRNAVGDLDSCVARLVMVDVLTGKPLDSLTVTSSFYFSSVFADCGRVVSYATGFNKDWEVVDNDYGDIVVADLNFDGRDDMAVINNSGSNGGVFYNYYIQESDRRFVLNRFLTDSMVYFPATIDQRAKRLITYVHAGVCDVSENIYQLVGKRGVWSRASHRIVQLCADSE